MYSTVINSQSKQDEAQDPLKETRSCSIFRGLSWERKLFLITGFLQMMLVLSCATWMLFEGTSQKSDQTDDLCDGLIFLILSLTMEIFNTTAVFGDNLSCHFEYWIGTVIIIIFSVSRNLRNYDQPLVNNFIILISSSATLLITSLCIFAVLRRASWMTAVNSREPYGAVLFFTKQIFYACCCAFLVYGMIWIVLLYFYLSSKSPHLWIVLAIYFLLVAWVSATCYIFSQNGRFGLLVLLPVILGPMGYTTIMYIPVIAPGTSTFNYMPIEKAYPILSTTLLHELAIIVIGVVGFVVLTKKRHTTAEFLSTITPKKMYSTGI